MPTRKEILQTKINTDLATATSITAAEHRGVETAIINASVPVNRGWFTGLDVEGTSVGTNLTCGGDITSATVTNQANVSTVSVYFATSMITANYIVKIYVQSVGSEITADAACFCPVFRVIDASNFWISIKEEGGTQNLRFHLEIVSLDY